MVQFASKDYGPVLTPLHIPSDRKFIHTCPSGRSAFLRRGKAVMTDLAMLSFSAAEGLFVLWIHYTTCYVRKPDAIFQFVITTSITT